jgi:hypothetical protein
MHQNGWLLEAVPGASFWAVKKAVTKVAEDDGLKSTKPQCSTTLNSFCAKEGSKLFKSCTTYWL